MDERDQKIQELERQMEEMRQELDRLRLGAPQFRYGQPPAPPPKTRPLRVALIVAGGLAALAALTAALVLLAFTLMNAADGETTAMAEELLWAAADEDTDRAYALSYPGAMTRDEFDQEFAKLCATWRDGGGGDAFELKRTSWSMNSSGGVAEYASVYEVSSGSARFTLYLDRRAHGETTGITGMRLSR